jgi:hypothetical protein
VSEYYYNNDDNINNTNIIIIIPFLYCILILMSYIM